MISLTDITVAFGARVLFDEVSLRVGGKERVSLVGSNGQGKSTLLKIMALINKPDSGEVALSRHTTMGYLPQEGIRYEGNTLYEEVYSSAGDVNKIQDELTEIENEMSNHPEPGNDDFMDLLNEYGELQERFQALDGYTLKSKIEKILIGLGFFEKDFERLTDEFSGGWQMRIALAKLLLQNPSILLLDEPTNHLDIESLIWVENYLKNYQGAIVLVSHDRNFLDNLTTRTIEISMGNVTEYGGNYSFYKKEKAVRKELLENQYNNQQKYLKQQERFIERFRYKASKAKAVQSRIKQLDKLDLIEIEDEEAAVAFSFPPATHSGKITIEIEGLTKTYDGVNNVLEGLDLIIERGEKIALVGVNGAGKSTFTRIIADIDKDFDGVVKDGHLVNKKFYAQNQAEELAGDKTVLETMEEAATGDIRKSLRTILGSFLFRGDDVFKKVAVLSGGEKSRLSLAKMLIEPSNFLILDEPTNHLDMKSKEVLMHALRKYEGTVLIVSHDRDFIDGIVDKVIEVKNKKIKVFYGNCSYYLEEKEKSEKQKTKVEQPVIMKQEIKKEVSHADKNEEKKRKAEQQKKNSELKKRITTVEKELEKCENKIKELELLMANEDFYKSGTDIQKTTDEYNSARKKAEQLTQEWEQLQLQTVE
ncbi:MAG: ABC-F family ATP-binding cassette domain-containing protein [Ignavibacteria bacterium]|nr:ABC-F family ATP-binding cassette domain-containing protein [Ignavibacteria bacterium]